MGGTCSTDDTEKDQRHLDDLVSLDGSAPAIRKFAPAESSEISVTIRNPGRKTLGVTVLGIEGQPYRIHEINCRGLLFEFNRAKEAIQYGDLVVEVRDPSMDIGGGFRARYGSVSKGLEMHTGDFELLVQRPPLRKARPLPMEKLQEALQKVKNGGGWFQIFLSDDEIGAALGSRKDFLLAGLKAGGNRLDLGAVYVHPPLWRDPDVVLAFLGVPNETGIDVGHVAQLVPPDMWEDASFLDKALDCCPYVLPYILRETWPDARALVLKVVAKDGAIAEGLPDRFRDDAEIMRAAVASKPEAFIAASERLKTDPGFASWASSLR